MHTTRILAAIALLAAATGCGPAPGAPDAHHHRSPSPTTPAPSPSPTAAGGMVHIHDPGHVTYSVALAAGQCHAGGTSPATYRPDRACTPGGVDPAVTQANLQATICRPGGYTKSVRPPVSETGAAKRKQYSVYGIPAGTTSELDHLVPLGVGGDNDIANLWPEVGAVPNAKDKVELDVHDAVCAGRVQLAAAQEAIASDWTTAERVLGIN